MLSPNNTCAVCESALPYGCTVFIMKSSTVVEADPCDISGPSGISGLSSISIHTTIAVSVNLTENGHSTNGSSGSQTPKS